MSARRCAVVSKPIELYCMFIATTYAVNLNPAGTIEWIVIEMRIKAKSERKINKHTAH